MRLAYSVFILFFCGLSMATEPNYQQMIQTSLNQLQQTNQTKAWAYTKTTTINNDNKPSVSVESFDPKRAEGQQWLLESDNGKEPDIEQLQQYFKQKTAELAAMEKQQQAGQEQALLNMIDLTSLKLEQNQGQSIIFVFTPILANMGENSQNKLSGRLILDHQNQQVKQVQISNKAPLSPVPNITLSHFEMQFDLIMQQQTLLPHKIAITINGKSAGKKVIKQNSEEIYSNYRYTGK